MILKLPCNEIPLSANIVYRLLCDSINKKRSKSDNAKHEYSTFTQTHLFGDLNTLIDTSRSDLKTTHYLYGDNTLQKPYENMASKFRYGKVKTQKSQIYLFNNNKYVSEFDEQIKNNYSAAYTKAVEFSHKYFGNKESTINDTLVRKLLYLIINDIDIIDSQYFYICSDRSTKTKADLRNIETIEFEAFLLGVWHYLLVAQKLQAGLEEVDDISIDGGYEHLKVKLIYDDSQDDQVDEAASDIVNDEKISDKNANSIDEKDDGSSDQSQPTLNTNDKNNTITIDPNKIKVIYIGSENVQVATTASASDNNESTGTDDRQIIEDNDNVTTKESTNAVSSANGNDEGSSNNVKKKIKKNASKYSGSETILPPDDSDLYPMELDRDNIISVLEKNDIRLSRAIFFYLLTNNIQTVHPKRDRNAAQRLFLDLVKLTVGHDCEIRSEQKVTGYCHDKFRQFQILSSAHCLDDQEQINTFSARLIENYEDVLCSMIEIRKKYFCSEEKNEALVVELIEFIKNDNNIDDNQEFFVCSDGSPMTKAELCDAEELEFEPFLLGVWHYVVSLLDSVDSADEYTFDKVFRVRYKSNGTDHTIYRTGDIISEQSELYVELTYLED